MSLGAFSPLRTACSLSYGIDTDTLLILNSELGFFSFSPKLHNAPLRPACLLKTKRICLSSLFRHKTNKKKSANENLSPKIYIVHLKDQFDYSKQKMLFSLFSHKKKNLSICSHSARLRSGITF